MSNPYGIDIDDAAPAAHAAPVPQAPPPPAVPIKAGIDVSGGTTPSAEDAARIQRDNDILINERGFATDPTLYAVGHALAASGLSEMRRKKAAADSLGFASTEMDALQTRITGEAREDVRVPLGVLKMHDDGLVRWNGTALPLEERAAERLLSLVCPGGAGYLAWSAPDIRAWNFNVQLARREDKRLDLVLRTRLGDAGDRRIWAVVSGSHPGRGFDTDRIAALIGKAAGPEQRARVMYDGYSAQADLTTFTPIAPENMGVGEVFNLGSRLTWGDFGAQALDGEAFAERIRCVNASTNAMKGRGFRLVHRGSGEHLLSRLRDGLRKTGAEGAEILVRWGEASRDNIIEAALGERGIEAAFTALVERRMVSVPGHNRDALIAGLMGSWQAEPGYSRTAVVNAVTRFAHEGQFANPWAGASLEEQAGKILFARRLDLSAVS